jgi:hypothetical protein
VSEETPPRIAGPNNVRINPGESLMDDNRRLLIPSLMASLLLYACASSSPPSLGDRMIGQSQDTRDLGEAWNKASKQVEEGEKLKKDGQKQVDDGQKKITKGQQMIEDGRQTMRESEQTFEQRFPGTL